MRGKIAFEEQIAIKETLEQRRVFAGDSARLDQFSRQILDVGDERLEFMDKTGIEFAILSLNAPGIQAVLDTQRAIYLAKKTNDEWHSVRPSVSEDVRIT